MCAYLSSRTITITITTIKRGSLYINSSIDHMYCIALYLIKLLC